MHNLPQIIKDVLPLLNHYGYLAVFGAVMLEDFGVPLPGETILIAASAVSAFSGHLFTPWVLLLGFAGAVIGDNIGFAIGHFGGRRLVLKFGRYVFIKEKQLDWAENFFNRHGGKVVMVARFIEIFRQLNGIVAGISGMRWRSFLLFNTIGAALWVGVWGGVGYFFGNKLNVIMPVFKRFEIYFIIVVAVIVLILIARHFLTRRREAGSEG